MSTTSPSDKEIEKQRPDESGRLTPDGSPLGVLQLIDISEKHHPAHWSPLKKWPLAAFYCLLQVFVTILSTSYISAEFLVQEKFGGSTQVVALGQSLFIVGTAVGPAFLGPLSDINGRKWVYVGSIALYGILQIVSRPSGSGSEGRGVCACVHVLCDKCCDDMRCGATRHFLDGMNQLLTGSSHSMVARKLLTFPC